MMTTLENAIQKSITRPRRSVRHMSFLWALCQEFVLVIYQSAWKGNSRKVLHPLLCEGLPYASG
jgi:hypothetical protein